MDLDSQLCYCFHVKKRKIVNFVKQTRPRRASQISECFGAGTGCGWCIPFLKRIHRQIAAGEIVEADDISSTDYESLRRQYLDGISDGSIEQNTQATEECPLSLRAGTGSGSGATGEVAEPGASPADSADAERREGRDAGPDWDVSDRYSRERAPEPEPELISEEFLAGMDDDEEP